MRRWQSHKIVEAEPITSFADTITSKTVTVGDDRNGARFEVPEKFFARGLPEVGDYLVRYENGWLSWSPKAAFESGYTEIGKDGDFSMVNRTGAELDVLRASERASHKAELDAAVEHLSSIEPPARDKLVRFLVARIAKFEEGYDASDAHRMEELSWLLLQAVGGNIL